MNAREKIENALKTVKGEGAVNAGNVFKGYEASTLKNGWHYQPFNGQVQYLGRSADEAIEQVHLMAEY